MSQSRFEIFNSQDGQFQFRLKAPNNETIGVSERYVTKQGAQGGISSVRTNSQVDSRYTIFKGLDYQWYFNLKGGNGEIILRSEGYTTQQGAQRGAGTVKFYAPSAPVIDFTIQQQRASGF